MSHIYIGHESRLIYIVKKEGRRLRYAEHISKKDLLHVSKRDLIHVSKRDLIHVKKRPTQQR